MSKPSSPPKTAQSKSCLIVNILIAYDSKIIKVAIFTLKKSHSSKKSHQINCEKGEQSWRTHKA